MKNIMLEWRKFLNEDSSFFGEKFLEFKEKAKNTDEPLDVAYKLGLRRIGEGSTRVVFSLPDNNDFVLKIINTHQMSKVPGQDPNKGENRDVHGFTKQLKKNANMYEADIKLQIENPSLFPRSTEHAEDYSWILVEKVDKMTQEDFRKILGLPVNIPFISIMGAVSLIIEAKQNLDNKKHYSHKFVVETKEDELLSGDTTLPTELEKSTEKDSQNIDDTIELSKKDDKFQKSLESVRDRVFDPLKKVINSILKNPQAVRIILMMAKNNIPPSEFKAANLGISTLNGGKMVLLDTSMWDDK